MIGPDQVSRFERDGFLAHSDLFSSRDIGEVRALLDPLFDAFESLPSDRRRDLGGSQVEGTQQPRSAEINRAVSVEPRLRRTAVFQQCLAAAKALGMRFPAYVFDHAIYKAPHNQRATPWHQDHAYTGQRRILRTLHFWIPLQDATVENGCMQFIRGSHRAGLSSHRRLADGHVLETQIPEHSDIVPCPVPRGGLTIHTPLTLHYTGPNESGDMRRAWIIHFGAFGRLAKLHPSLLFDRITGRPGHTHD